MAKKKNKAAVADTAAAIEEKSQLVTEGSGDVETKRLSDEETEGPIDEEVKGLSNKETEEIRNDFPCVVIPFRADKAKGEELKYAVRAWDKHLPGVRIVVIGDSMPWFSNALLHIPHKAVSDNPQVDVANKMMVAIASAEVPDLFIWSNDDIYPVSNLILPDIDVVKANGRLGAKGSSGSVYAQNAKRTQKALWDMGIERPWDYATHTPVVMWKKELADVIAKHNCEKEGHLVYTLFANTVWRNYNPIQVDNGAGGSIVACVYRPNPDKAVLEKAFEERKFINHNDAGWPAVLPYLKERFGEKSRFEK